MWRFLKGTTLHDPSSYSRLGKFIPNAFGIDGLEFWRGPFFVPNNLPGVGINASGSDQAPLGWNWPAHMILVHPYDQVPAIVDWHSPITGTVRITITVSDLDPQCGDGIRWFVDRGTATVASGSILNGDVSQSASRSASVHVGSDIYVLVDDGGAGHTIGCDSTGLLLSIHT